MDTKWERLNDKLRQGASKFEEPDYPFKKGKLICDYNPLYKKIYDKERFVNL